MTPLISESSSPETALTATIGSTATTTVRDHEPTTPAARIAAQDSGKILADDHPKVREVAEMLNSARLLFLQSETKIADLVLDVTARLQKRKISARATDALSAMIECAPAPESPEDRRDAATYVAIYYRCRLKSPVQAEAILAMRAETAELERRHRAAAIASKPVDKTAPNAITIQEPPERERQRVADSDPDPRAFDERAEEEVEEPKEGFFLNRPGSEAKIPIAEDLASIDRLAAIASSMGPVEAEKYSKTAAFFHVDDWTKVSVLKRTEIAALVVIQSGAHQGQRGWVPTGYLREKVEKNVTGRAATLLRSGKSLESSGQRKQARAYYEQILKEYPDSDEAKEARKRLDAQPPPPAKKP